MKSIIFYLILFVGVRGCFQNQPTVHTEMEGKPIPSFKLLSVDSTGQINTDNITSYPIVLFYFSPNCPYCRAQTETIVKNIQSLKQIQFYFFSNFPLTPIRNFSEKYQLNKFENIVVGQDYENFFGDHFKTPGVPYMAVYGKNKLLKQVLIGTVNPSLLKDIAFQ